MNADVSRIVRQLLQRIPSRTPRRLDARLRTTGSRRAQFVSFLESSGYRTHNVDTYERSLQRRRFAKAALMWAAAFAVAWVVIESARAVSIF
jgi:uroporphyrinogen-III synthase